MRTISSPLKKPWGEDDGRRPSALWLVVLLAAIATLPIAAEERTHTPEELEKIAKDGDLQAEVPTERPANLPDLTKGATLPEETVDWNLGPTGIVGMKNGGLAGDQVQVIGVLPGSPAEGKLQWGDVILGVNGKNFVAGGNMGIDVGNAIIESEKEENKGLLRLRFWRDRNFANRNGAQNVTGVDIEKLFKEAEEDDGMYEWKSEEGRTEAVRAAGFDKYPIDGQYLETTLQLQVMGTYSDTSPWDCPVAEKIRENAWKVMEAKFTPDKKGQMKDANTVGVLALLASGKPYHRELAMKWVHSKDCKAWSPDKKISMEGGGMMSWQVGFVGLECALYYEATGDEYVLPALREYAVKTAMGQSGGGTWGHTFAYPTFNGGKLHMRNPGYGALDAAGNRCFFLVALAKKLGIEDPEIDGAVQRAIPFWRSFVDKGAIGYGDHPPSGTDDSNGKNFGAAYAFYLMGDKEAAKYFSEHSAHASFSRRGGHGSPNLWHYSPLSANICGPEATMVTMRNMRWFYTLARRHDGSFVVQGEQAGIGGKPVRDATATYLLHYSAPLRQLLITGKDPDKSLWMTPRDMNELLVSARPQLSDPLLLERSGKPWKERSTPELFELLGHFFPKFRANVATELGARFQAGEKDIVPRLLELLKSPEARYRGGACRALTACGPELVRASFAEITALLHDPAEFVRMDAVGAIADATEPDDPQRLTLLLTAASEEYAGMSSDTANVRSAVKGALFPRRGTPGAISTTPFELGLDPKFVRMGLSKLVTLDPGGSVPKGWSKDTLLQLAGPITFVADEIQINDAMFALGRTEAGRNLLAKYGYREAIEADAFNLLQRCELDRTLRNRVTFKLPFISAKMVNTYKGACRDLLDPLKQWLQDNPIATVAEKRGKGIPPIITPIDELIRIIEDDKTAIPLPSIGPEVAALFQAELAKFDGADEKIRLCRAELAHPEERTYFRKMAAMSQLVDLLGPDALTDLVPYLGHEKWRLNKHSRMLALNLVKAGAGGALTELFKQQRGATAAGILTVLADGHQTVALDTARTALKHADDEVRRAAVQALMTLGGDEVLPEVLAFMRQAREPQELRGCESALLSDRNNANRIQRIRSEAIAMLPKAEPVVRRSLFWVLAQLGGPEALAALQQATATEDDAEFKEIVVALSYSPDRAVDALMLDLARKNENRAVIVAAESVRRMVGPGGVGDVTDTQRLDFAIPMLQIVRDYRLIAFMGKIHTGRSVQALLEIMKVGSTEDAAESIIGAAEGMEHAPEADRKMAVDALTEVIQYIEVTQLRGGVSEKDPLQYPRWKVLQTRAGKALLKLHKPGQAPIHGFDNVDLDL